ncbi:MAG TPA: lamin tail domain-containing protein, partial [Anaerolineae bacterium]|nr:lamin tail domain-containing protein [Anaerolineae bacterium]
MVVSCLPQGVQQMEEGTDFLPKRLFVVLTQKEMPMFKRSLWLLVALILPAILFASLISQTRATSTAVLIDAVLYDGQETGEPDEAVRLINVSGTAVDISGWAINDAVDSSKLVITDGVSIAPQQTIWLAKDGAAFQRQFGFWPDFEVNDTSASIPNFASGSWP